MSTQQFSVLGSGRSWFVLRDGCEVAGPYDGHDKALDRLESLKREAGRKQRKCIRCTKPFMSEGAHHRMCTPCRNYASDIFDGAV